MILVERIEKCNDCASHEIHGIYTSDSFENETGIYCGKVEDTSDSWERHTYDGRVDKKLIHSYDTWESKTASIPDWCPILLDSYKHIIDKIYQSARQPIDEDDKKIIEVASYIIETLGGIVSFKDFVYKGGLPYGSIKRDLCLVEIAQLMRSQFMVSEKDIENLGFGEEDSKVLKMALKTYSEEENIKKLIKDFDLVKKEAKGTIMRPVLDSEIAVPAAIYLANSVVCPRYFTTDVAFSFKKSGKKPVPTAEVRYTAKEYNDDYDPPRPFNYVEWATEGAEKNDILLQKLILKKIFGINTYEYFINGIKIPINEIKKN